MAFKMKKIRRSNEESMDYISRLPEPVIHHILSFLQFKELARCSVLSRAWNLIWLSYPKIDLVLRWEENSGRRFRRRFMKQAEMILSQCLFRKNWVQKLKLKIYFPKVEKLAPNLDRWLGAATERSVSKLVILIDCLAYLGYPMTFYSIPKESLTALLKVLKLEGCVFDDNFTNVRLPNLQKFSVWHCQFVGENLFNRILCGCPMLESLRVSCCEGVRGLLSFTRNCRIKYFNFQFGKELERIEIVAPSLETFVCSSLSPFAIDIASCTALKRFELHRVVLSNARVSIEQILSELLNIEELHLQSCKVVDKVKISSSCLRRLVITNHCIDFSGVHLDTPNLIDLKFHDLGVRSTANRFRSWKAQEVENVNMEFNVGTFLSACKAGLKDFLKKLHNYNDLKLVIECRGGGYFIIHENLDTVAFSTLVQFFSEALPDYVVISSEKTESFLTQKLNFEDNKVQETWIFSSRERIEMLYKKMSNVAMLMNWNSDFQLLCTKELERRLSSSGKSFKEIDSTVCQAAKITLYSSLDSLVKSKRIFEGRT